MNTNQIIQEKDTITLKDLEDFVKRIFRGTPKKPEFVIYKTSSGTISFLKDNLKPLHE